MIFFIIWLYHAMFDRLKDLLKLTRNIAYEQSDYSRRVNIFFLRVISELKIVENFSQSRDFVPTRKLEKFRKKIINLFISFGTINQFLFPKSF